MRVKIYQINSKYDKNKVKFRGLKELPRFQDSAEVDPSLYENVFDAEIDDMGLEDVFCFINTQRHPLYRGHLLALSDVVVTEEGAFFCTDWSFKKISFDESKTRQQDDLIKVLYVEPHKKPFVTEIKNTLEGQQQAVKGFIEYIYNQDETIFVINDENKINGMEGNRRIEGDVIAGPFFIAGDTGESLCSLDEEQLESYAKRFAEPEDIPASEIEEYVSFAFWTM